LTDGFNRQNDDDASLHDTCAVLEEVPVKDLARVTRYRRLNVVRQMRVFFRKLQNIKRVYVSSRIDPVTN
jgi:hypothetical protein